MLTSARVVMHARHGKCANIVSERSERTHYRTDQSVWATETGLQGSGQELWTDSVGKAFK